MALKPYRPNYQHTNYTLYGDHARCITLIWPSKNPNMALKQIKLSAHQLHPLWTMLTAAAAEPNPQTTAMPTIRGGRGGRGGGGETSPAPQEGRGGGGGGATNC